MVRMRIYTVVGVGWAGGDSACRGSDMTFMGKWNCARGGSQHQMDQGKQQGLISCVSASIGGCGGGQNEDLHCRRCHMTFMGKWKCARGGSQHKMDQGKHQGLV